MKFKQRLSLKVFMAFCFIIVSYVYIVGLIPAFAATEVSGLINTNTTWTASASPYTMTGGVLVRSEATLTIEPGVTINIATGLSIQIE